MTRSATNYLIDMMNEGIIDPQSLAKNLLGYMPESEVVDFAECEYGYDYDCEDE